MNTPSTSISPGLGGFIAFFVLAIALWLLMRNMNARMRRMSYRAEEEQRKAEAETSGRRPVGEDDGPGAAPEEADVAEQAGGQHGGQDASQDGGQDSERPDSTPDDEAHPKN